MVNDDKLNEFRQDLVSGEWVLFATGRAKRPGETNGGNYFPNQTKENCPSKILKRRTKYSKRTR